MNLENITNKMRRYLKYKIYKLCTYLKFKFKKNKEINFRNRTLFYFVFSLGVLSVLSAIGRFVRLDLMMEKYLSDFNVFDLLLGQISNTLIVLTLTSVLSENFGQVYWVDVKKDKLISPFLLCFAGMTVYLLMGLVFSIGSYVMSFYVGTIVSFLVSIFLLMGLTLMMIKIYFGREKLKIQLKINYKRNYFLTKIHYKKIEIEDYVFDINDDLNFLDKLKRLEKDCKTKKFFGKLIFVFLLKMEIKEIDAFLKSDSRQADKELKFMQDLSFEDIKYFDKKIEEYTKKAIKKNDRDVIMENIELLVECENCDIFLHLFEDLFDWDEEYACRMLGEINCRFYEDEKGLRSYKYVRQYAFQKLISCSGNFDAMQNLLLHYDLKYQGTEQVSGGISSLDLFQLRRFHVPIKEAYVAYMEGKYAEANKIIDVIIMNYNEDLENLDSILKRSGITQMEDEKSLVFSYVTEDEKFYIDQIREKDDTISVLSEEVKKRLESMKEVSLS